MSDERPPHVDPPEPAGTGPAAPQQGSPVDQATSAAPSRHDATVDHASDTTPNASEPTSHLLPQVPHYEILREIGRGGMGVVYQARQKSLNRIVALKMILAGQHASQAARQRFLREAEVVARLRHPNIVQVFDYGEEEGHSFLAMEFIDGSDLQQSAKMTPRAAAEIVEQLARAVHEAHRQGIVHRDIKPANILMDPQGVPKITDFGLAKLADEEAAAELTGVDHLLGTAAYMPPEQARGDARKATAAADVYALGAVLYFLLTSQPPFLGRTALDVLKKVQQNEPFPPRRLAHGISRDLETICLKCLAKSPARRFASAEELAQDLGRYLRDQPIASRRASPWERAARWVRRSTLAKVVLVLLAAMVCIAAWKLHHDWQYEWPATSYFRSLISQNGELVGVGKLTPEVAGGRAESLRFVTQGRRGPLLRIDSVNAKGQPTPSLKLASLLDPGDADLTKYTVVRVDLERNARGELSRFVARDRSDREIWSFVFTKYPVKGHYVDRHGSERSRTGTGAAYLEFDYDSAGFVQETRYVDAQSYPVPNARGVFGERILKRQGELPSLLAFLDAEGHPRVLDGVFFIQRTYSADGLLLEQACLAEDRELAFCTEGYSRVTYEYDAAGNEIKRAFWNTEGQPALISSGVSQIHRELDEHGNMVKELFLNAEAEPTGRAPEGSAEIRYQYDDLGNLIETEYRNAEGNLCLTHRGYAIRTSQRDTSGNIVGQEFFDVDREPTLDIDGVFQKVSSFDEDGRTLEIANFDTRGQPTLNRENWARVVFGYDRAGNLNHRQFLDAAGQPTISRDGYCSWESTYDGRGNISEETFLGIDGRPVIGRAGYARAVATYNEQGKISERRLYGVDNRPILSLDGYHRVVLAYDARGWETRRQHFDVQNQPTWHKDGYSEVRQRNNERGDLIELSYFAPDGAAINSREGYHRKSQEFDQRGFLLRVSFFDTMGQPTAGTRDGAASLQMDYDRRGNIIRQTNLDGQGQPLSGVLKSYSPRGELLEETFTDGRGNIIEVDGVARWQYKYDARGRETGFTCFNRRGEKSAGPGGICCVESVLDLQGNPIDSRFYGANGEPITAEAGHARVTRKYDPRGNVVEEAYFDTEDNRYFSQDLGYSLVRFKYDSFGNAIERAYFGVREEPVLYQGAYHISRSRYENGHDVETAYLGLEGQPVDSAEGQARVERDFDPQGRQVEQRRFDLSGQLTDRLLHWARETVEYDAHGNAVRLAWFNAQGEPAVDETGYSIERRYYDALGRPEAFEYFDGEEQPVLKQPDGYWRMERREDRYGNEVQVRFFGVDGKPVAISAGYAERTFEVDPFGQVMSTSYYDASGERLNSRIVVDQVLPGAPGDAAGLRAGDQILRLNDTPVQDVRMFTYRRARDARAEDLLRMAREQETLTVSVPAGALGVMLRDVIDSASASGK